MMVQHFQTLPEVGRSGLIDCTIPKSILTAQKHGAASIQEAWGPCWSHPKIMVSLVQKKKLQKKKTGPAIRVVIRQQFLAIRSQVRQFGCSVHAQNVGNSAIRSPDSFPLNFLKGKQGKEPMGAQRLEQHF